MQESLPIITAHAAMRWHERFQNWPRTIQQEYVIAAQHRTGKRTLKTIAQQCGYKGKTRIFKGVYFKVSPHGIVFVIRPQPTTIITVFQL